MKLLSIILVLGTAGVASISGCSNETAAQSESELRPPGFLKPSTFTGVEGKGVAVNFAGVFCFDPAYMRDKIPLNMFHGNVDEVTNVWSGGYSSNDTNGGRHFVPNATIKLDMTLQRVAPEGKELVAGAFSTSAKRKGQTVLEFSAKQGKPNVFLNEIVYESDSAIVYGQRRKMVCKVTTIGSLPAPTK